jgi:hypothetical protein
LKFEFFLASFPFVFDAEAGFERNANALFGHLDHERFSGFERIGQPAQFGNKQISGYDAFDIALSTCAHHGTKVYRGREDGTTAKALRRRRAKKFPEANANSSGGSSVQAR